jgi:hypothetical protein
MLFLKLHKDCSGDAIPGKCAYCEREVWQSLAVLDDTYNVWSGECPYCDAINLLSTTAGLRGYSSAGMSLVLPYDEEVQSNNMPPKCPTRGPYGSPPTMHGSPLGELCHKLLVDHESPPGDLA